MLTTIPEGVFWKCKALVRVRVPASVTTIEAGAFDDCAGLAEVHVDAPGAEWLASDDPTEQGTQSFILADPARTAQLLRTEACDKYLTRK